MWFFQGCSKGFVIEQVLTIQGTLIWRYPPLAEESNHNLFIQKIRLASWGGDTSKKPRKTNMEQHESYTNNMGVSQNSGVSPQIIHFNRVFHYFHHPFWGYHDFWKYPYSSSMMICFFGNLALLSKSSISNFQSQPSNPIPTFKSNPNLQILLTASLHLKMDGFSDDPASF